MQSTLVSPPYLRRLGELGRASDAVWFLALNVGLWFTVIAAYPFAFSESGKFWAYAGLLIRAALYVWAGDALRGRGGETLYRLLQLGLVAGAFEILVDWGLIHWISHGRLIYLTNNDVVLLGSPIWMPLAWACVIVELGYPAIRLFEILRRRIGNTSAAITASFINAIGAGVTVGFYEYFAYRSNWWKYEKANVMIGDFCALYIPLGEFLMFLPVIWITAPAIAEEERTTARAVSSGVKFAISIALGYAIAYFVLEGFA